MTIATTNNRIQYSGDGITLSFAFPYPFYNDSELVVELTNTSTGVTTTKTLISDYTISGTKTNEVYESGANIVFATEPTASERVTIYRELPLTQTTDYTESGTFPAQSHERALDKLTLIIQQLKDDLDRTLKAAESSTGLALTLPDAAANKLIGWNSEATAIENKDTIDNTILLPTFASNGLKFARVNASGSNLEYIDPATIGRDAILPAYAGNSLNFLRVNAGESGVEYFNLNSFNLAVTTNTSTTLTTTTSTRIVRNNSSANVTITLHDPTTCSGQEIFFDNPTQHTMTMSAFSVHRGLYSSSSFKVTPRTKGSIYSDGTRWNIRQEFMSEIIDAGAITITATTTNPTKGPTLSTDKVHYKRIGDQMHAHYMYLQTTTGGSAGSGEYRLAIPGGWTVDTNKITSIVSSIDNLIGAAMLNAVGTNSGTGYAFLTSTTTFGINVFEDAGNTKASLSSTFLPLSVADNRISASIIVPITNW